MRHQVVRRWPLVGMVVAVMATSAIVEHATPAALLVPPNRPFEDHGDGAVRTESASYPRYATGADDVRTRIDRQPQRIISQDWAADEYLYSVVPPERVVGVSDSAYEETISNVYQFAERYHPIVAMDPERVLMANPDLVFTPESARSDVPGLLRSAGLPVYRIYTMFETLGAVADHIRLVGYLTGEDDRAAEEVARFEQTIARAAARRPHGMAAPRVLGLGGDYTYGSKTLFNDVLRVLGAENVAAVHGLVGYDRATDEHIVRWDPDWIVTGADRGRVEAVRAEVLARPAIAATSAGQHGRVIVLENSVFLPLSPFTSRLVEALADALYGGAP